MPIALIALLAASAPIADATLKPYDSLVRAIGRFDGRDPAGPKISWPATGAEVRFRGSAISVTVKDFPLDRWKDWLQIFVDGSPTHPVALKPGEQTIELATGLVGPEHTVRIAKRTEPFCGSVQIESWKVVGGTALRPRKPQRRLEVIGDSISCGFGNLANKSADPFTDETEDATQAYGALAAADLHADYVCHAWSGRTMAPTNTIPSIYDLSVPTDPTSKVAIDAIAPDAILVNLGTNDFRSKNPDQAEWTTAYKEFLHRLRVAHPRAILYVAIGSMMTDNWPRGNNALSTIRNYCRGIVDDLTKAGDARVRFIEFDPQNAEIDGLGASFHPNLKTHRKMADKLVVALKRDLNWK